MLWIKGLHIIFMVTWFAGLFYLPRLFVYHAVTEDGECSERFKVMERKLFIIMTIGAVFTAFFGGWLLIPYMQAGLAGSGWLHAKLPLVALLIAYHVYLGKLVAVFRRDQNRHDHRYYRWINEVPALFLVVVVLLAVARPF